MRLRSLEPIEILIFGMTLRAQGWAPLPTTVDNSGPSTIFEIWTLRPSLFLENL